MTEFKHKIFNAMPFQDIYKNLLLNPTSIKHENTDITL